MLRIEQNGVLVPIPSDVESDGTAAVLAYLAALPPALTAAAAQARYDQAMRALTEKANDLAHSAALKRQAEVAGPTPVPEAHPAAATAPPPFTTPVAAAGDGDEE